MRTIKFTRFCKTYGTVDFIESGVCSDTECLSCQNLQKIFDKSVKELMTELKEKLLYDKQKTSGEEIRILKESNTQLEGQDAIEDM